MAHAQLSLSLLRRNSRYTLNIRKNISLKLSSKMQLLIECHCDVLRTTRVGPNKFAHLNCENTGVAVKIHYHEGERLYHLYNMLLIGLRLKPLCQFKVFRGNRTKDSF